MATNTNSIGISSISRNDTANKTSPDTTNLTLTEKKKQLVLKDPAAPDFENKKNKVPKRTIHFSDGVLEEYSETEDEDEVDNTPPVNPKALKWGPWFLHYTIISAKGTLNVADYLGEKLAWFFGITSPKYQYAIDEYKRMKQQEEEEKEREEQEREFQRQRRQEAGLDVEEGVPTYSNRAFGLEVCEGEGGESVAPPPLPVGPPQAEGDTQQQSSAHLSQEERF